MKAAAIWCWASATTPQPIVGTNAFLNKADIAEKIFTKLGFRVDVEDVSHPSGRVLVFIIPPRPRGTAFALDGSYLMRCGEQLLPMSEDRLRKIFQEGEPAWLEETSGQAGLSAEAVIELLDIEAFFNLLKLPVPPSVQDIVDELSAEGLVDAVAGRYSIRRMGALLLAKQLSSFPEVRLKGPRVITYRGSSKISTTTSDITATKGYAVGFQALMRFVVKQIPQNEVIKDALRKEITLLPEVAVRELVANALIHQDFSIGGASVMMVYNNRLEISNPGIPILPMERFIDCHQSRNERLAALMRRMGICEEKGSGIDKVVAIAEAFQLPAPDFRIMGNRSVITIMEPKEFNEMDREERLRACYQHCVLRWVTHNRMTNQSLRERFHLTEKKTQVVSQIIAASIEAGQIRLDEKVGASRKYARYIPHWASPVLFKPFPLNRH
jgi:predicted HTH transcriptional regulator